MYPFLRLFTQLRRAQKMPKIGFFDQHVVRVRVYPWDLDMFNELNNGRTLSLYDLARISLSLRCGLRELLRDNRWGLTVAGSYVTYRKRVQAWQLLDITAQCVGVDEKFFYLLQNIYRNGEPVGQGLFRTAMTQKGIVPPRVVLKLLK